VAAVDAEACPHCGRQLAAGDLQAAPASADYHNRLRQQRFALEAGGEKRLLLAWKGVE
jgi:rRNA maturation protein Nop10